MPSLTADSLGEGLRFEHQRGQPCKTLQVASLVTGDTTRHGGFGHAEGLLYETPLDD